MKLLVDNQLPMQLALEFRRRGDECLHVLEIQLDRATDIALWDYAKKEGQILVSKDEDFVLLANRPGDTGRLFWVRLGNCRNAVLIEAFDRVYYDLVQSAKSGQRIIEIR